MSLPVRLVDFFLQCFQLGDHFEIFGPACGALHANQPWQVEQAHFAAEDGDRERVRQQVLVSSATCNFAEQIDRARTRREREVQAGAQRLDRPVERQSWRRAAQVRLERRERRDDARQILGVARITDVEVIGESRRAVRTRGNAANDDEVDLRLAERAE